MQTHLKIYIMQLIPKNDYAMLKYHLFSHAGAAALDPKANGKISLIAFIFIISTNGLGSAIGMGATLIFGAGNDYLFIHHRLQIISHL